VADVKEKNKKFGFGFFWIWILQKKSFCLGQIFWRGEAKKKSVTTWLLKKVGQRKKLFFSFQG